jgi:hypothetical protein
MKFNRLLKIALLIAVAITFDYFFYNFITS